MSEQQVQKAQPDLMTAAEYARTADDQNLLMGIVGGIIGGGVGAALWAVITLVTDFQIGWMAIGVGFLTGLGVRTLGKGREPVYGIIGAVLALIGCVIGNLVVILIVATREVPGFAFTINDYIEILTSSANPMDLLFYGLALFAGFRSSIAK
jgi:hypothetical protein